MNRKIYRKIAKKYGVTVEEVKREMKVAIDQTHIAPNSVNFKSAKPTPDELIDYVIGRIQIDNSLDKNTPG